VFGKAAQMYIFCSEVAKIRWHTKMGHPKKAELK
jgi:hypothetical protein